MLKLSKKGAKNCQNNKINGQPMLKSAKIDAGGG
jgi:hypothetical protein